MVCQPYTGYQMIDDRGGGKVAKPTTYTRACHQPDLQRVEYDFECTIFSCEQDPLYNVHWPILYNAIPPLLLLCCFYLLKELPYTESLGFFGKYSGSLSSGLLLTTSRDRPRRTGGQVCISKRNFMSTMTKVKRRCFPPTVQCPGLGFPQGDRREMWGSLAFYDSGLTTLYD
jgi:hypothetical protein